MTGSKAYLTPNQVARLLMVSPVTVRQWARRGLIDAATTPGGHRRFAPAEVERFARSRGIGVWQHTPHEYRLLVLSEDTELPRRLYAALDGTGRSIRLERVGDGFAAGLRVARNAPHAVVVDAALTGLNLDALCAQLRSERETVNTRVVVLAAESPDSATDSLRVDGYLDRRLDGRQLTQALGLDAVS